MREKKLVDLKSSLTLAAELGKRQPFEAAEQEAYLNIRRTGEALAAGFARLFKAHGLSEAKYNALRIVAGHGEGGASIQRIREHLVARVPDVTRLVDRLAADGLVERRRHERDGRVVLVVLTSAGREKLAGLREGVLELHRGQLGHMSEDELRRLSELLVRAREGCGGCGGAEE